MAQGAGFSELQRRAGGFNLLVMHREAQREPAGRVRIYIEGDGRAWRKRRVASADPTPRTPFAMRLAARDPAPAVAYIARPCQYLGAGHGSCAPRYWTSARFAPEIVAALDRMVTWIKRRAGARRLALVGYSGGGTLALLIAAGRHDVNSIVTVAAPLDLATWTRIHGDSPLAGSLNPADLATRLAMVPQIHLIGADDGNVPRQVAEAYLARMPTPNAGRARVVPGFDHRCCWIEKWPELLRRYAPVDGDPPT